MSHVEEALKGTKYEGAKFSLIGRADNAQALRIQWDALPNTAVAQHAERLAEALDRLIHASMFKDHPAESQHAIDTLKAFGLVKAEIDGGSA